VFGHIVIAYDGSVGADSALGVAAKLARLCEAELTVLTVYRHHSRLEASFSVQRPDDTETTDDIMRAYAREIAEAGKARATEAGAPRVRAFVKGGQPARGIVSFANEHKADLIVVGSRGLGSVEGFLVGSVSHKITGLAECPVLVV
jgi:nucleotide-binding universal stress UspA family protein